MFLLKLTLNIGLKKARLREGFLRQLLSVHRSSDLEMIFQSSKASLVGGAITILKHMSSSMGLGLHPVVYLPLWKHMKVSWEG